MRFSDFEKLGNLYLPKVWNQAGYMLMHRRKAFRFPVKAVVIDGSTYTSRGAGLTGAADGDQFIFSFWIKFNGKDGTLTKIFLGYLNAVGGKFTIQKGGANTILFDALDTGDVPGINFDSVSTFTAGATWNHVLISGDLNTTEQWCYINDASDIQNITNTDNGVPLEYTVSDWFVGSDNEGGDLLSADVAEVYFNIATKLDISVEANRRKFRTADGKPVDISKDWGGLGQPICYFSVRPGDAASAFLTNRGTGGDFNETGSLSIAATSPSD